jgi:hypothetical protein
MEPRSLAWQFDPTHGEGFAPGEVPGAMAAAGHVAQLSPDSQCDECPRRGEGSAGAVVACFDLNSLILFNFLFTSVRTLLRHFKLGCNRSVRTFGVVPISPHPSWIE